MGSIIFEALLRVRGLSDTKDRQAFLSPHYESSSCDPFLLPDMRVAVERIIKAKEKGELIYIYGDYDIDGLTATTILLDAFKSLGLRAQAFIPNRYVEGYGLTKAAIKTLVERGAQLIITVDCGSLSHAEIELSNSLGVDVIVTDHHSVADTMPPAVATINPKRVDHKYPFIDLAGCGVAFKLVQALQQKFDGLPAGQEKWLLDLVALGTVCDVVPLVGENRCYVYWGLQVLQKTRRPGIKALTSVAGLQLQDLNARHLGFVLGPHLNASGRLETAQLSLALLTTTDPLKAIEIAYQLQMLNQERRAQQQRIMKEATLQAEACDDPVLVLSDAAWSQGIVGIVAARMLEKFKKPTFILQEIGEESKGSARSFGDFSAVEGIRSADSLLLKGGGHKLAAGVTLLTKNIPAFRQALNEFYTSQNLGDQLHHLEPIAEVVIEDIQHITAELWTELQQLEPFGHGNKEPTFQLKKVEVVERREMGADRQHLKLHVAHEGRKPLAVVGFNMASTVKAQPGDVVDVWLQLLENEWRGNKSIEGRLLKVAFSEI